MGAARPFGAIMARQRRAARLLRARLPFGKIGKIKGVRLLIFPIKRVLLRQNDVGVKRVFRLRAGDDFAPSFFSLFFRIPRLYDRPSVKTPAWVSSAGVFVADFRQLPLATVHHAIDRYCALSMRRQKNIVRTLASFHFFLSLSEKTPRPSESSESITAGSSAEITRAIPPLAAVYRSLREKKRRATIPRFAGCNARDDARRQF